ALRPRPPARLPYTPLFRSQQEVTANTAGDAELIQKLRNLGYIGEERMTAHNNRGVIALDEGDVDAAIVDFEKALQAGDAGTMVRSEEHTSELQSPDHLVCR